MPAVKTYTRVNFQNYPSTSTPLNATNLNKLDKGIDDLDDEVVTVKNAIENMSFDADSISYDNTSSGLQATDVQDAVDEINDNLSNIKYSQTMLMDRVYTVDDYTVDDINQFDTIKLRLGFGNYIAMDEVEVTVAEFKTTSASMRMGLAYNNQSFNIYYNSDTSIKLAECGTGVVSVIGIKYN